MRRDIIVVDNFLGNPNAVREYALKQEYEPYGGKNWPSCATFICTKYWKQKKLKMKLN